MKVNISTDPITFAKRMNKKRFGNTSNKHFRFFENIQFSKGIFNNYYI